MHTFGLTWKPGSCRCFTSPGQGTTTFIAGGTTSHHKARLTPMGTIFRADGHTQEAMAHRIAKATSAFWANKDILQKPHLNMLEGFEHLILL